MDVKEIRVPSRGMRQTDVHMGREAMGKWIDADALKKRIDDCDICNICPDKDVRCDYDCDFPDCLTPKWETLIDSAPSIDIVRCAECKYYEAKEDWCYWRDEYTEPEYFCSYGEVRDE
jgi:hypothetical protein